MKIVFFFALALATAAAFVVPEEEVLSLDRFMPVNDLGGRIVGGSNAEIENYGYIVGLLTERKGAKYWCGGSLISLEWVLTAAHCTENTDKIYVYMGDKRRQQGTRVQAIKYFEHEKWNTITVANDIALLKIPKIKETNKIYPVKLDKNNKYTTKYNEKVVIAAGWGKTGDNNGSASLLQEANLTVITNGDCMKTYGSSVTNGNICCSTCDGGKRSTCSGDSGGPLVTTVDDNNKLLEPRDRIQIGLTSFGARAGCEKCYPVAFTFIATYRDWIKQNTGI